MWPPMMDPVLNGTDLPPMMLSFSTDNETATLTMLDNIAATIKVESPDPGSFVACSATSTENNTISSSTSCTSPVMASFSAACGTPTIVSISSGTKLSTVSSASNGSKAPSCKVCSDESSGFHYGVDSCEGCKGFFRRCITQGMTHKCSNSEKCEITPFTRNSCQYCRLKKCFAVGMSREASRLGRRPKKLKDPNADSSRSHAGNLPIAPYPSPAELHRMRMAELQRLLQANGTFKSELMQAFQSAQNTLQEQFGTTFTSPNTLTEEQTTSVASAGSLNGLSNGISTTVVNSSTVPGNMANAMAAEAATRGTSVGTSGAIRGLESGYSSMSSPSSTKSHGYSSMSSPSSTKSQSPNLYREQQQQELLPPISSVVNGNNDDSCSQMALEEHSEMVLDCDMANLFGQSAMSSDMDMMSSMVYTAMQHANKASQPSMQIHAMLPQSPNQPDLLSSGYNLATTDVGNANVTKTDRIMTFVKQETTDLRRQLIDQVTDTIVSAHMETCRVTHQAVEIAAREVEIKRRNCPEYGKDSTSMWQQFVKNMVREITDVVKFCKKLPGFTEIDQEDQIRLIKQGSFECLLCRFSMLVDCVNCEMMDPDMIMKCARDVVRAMPMGEFFEEFFVLANLFNPLNLTDGEVGLFTAVLALQPDRKDLMQKKTITKIQALFYQALYLLMKRNHSDADSLFKRMLNIIPVLRNINQKHCMALNNIKMRSPDKVEEFPQLHQEVFFYS